MPSSERAQLNPAKPDFVKNVESLSQFVSLLHIVLLHHRHEFIEIDLAVTYKKRERSRKTEQRDDGETSADSASSQNAATSRTIDVERADDFVEFGIRVLLVHRLEHQCKLSRCHGSTAVLVKAGEHFLHFLNLTRSKEQACSVSSVMRSPAHHGLACFCHPCLTSSFEAT
jgi:hypothetical protein